MDWNTIFRTARAVSASALAVTLLAAFPGYALASDLPAAGSLDEAVAHVEREHSGRILSARAEQREQGVVYLIRLLTPDQQVRDFEIPGAGGARP